MALVWPVPGHYEIRSGFTERRWYGQHDAIDILCPVGARVVAIAPGQVIFAGNAGDCGIGVWLAHDDGSRSHYCHLEPVGAVGLGHVAAGATLGCVGMTGVTRVPHLHLNLFMQQRPAGVLSDWISWVGMWAVDPEHYLTPMEEDMALDENADWVTFVKMAQKFMFTRGGGHFPNLIAPTGDTEPLLGPELNRAVGHPHPSTSTTAGLQDGDKVELKKI